MGEFMKKLSYFKIVTDSGSYIVSAIDKKSALVHFKQTYLKQYVSSNKLKINKIKSK
jgi:hypothetical protein